MIFLSWFKLGEKSREGENAQRDNGNGERVSGEGDGCCVRAMDGWCSWRHNRGLKVVSLVRDFEAMELST